jgi:hypothetical protein
VAVSDRFIEESSREPDDQARTVRHLVELIDAIDRRLHHSDRAGEAAIEASARQLRAEALARIAEIERAVAKH